MRGFKGVQVYQDKGNISDRGLIKILEMYEGIKTHLN